VNIDTVNKWLTALQSIAVIAAAAVAVWQLSEISRQSKLQAQALQQARQAASATLRLQLGDKLDGGRERSSPIFLIIGAGRRKSSRTTGGLPYYFTIMHVIRH